jgi:hypothetical protein
MLSGQRGEIQMLPALAAGNPADCVRPDPKVTSNGRLRLTTCHTLTGCQRQRICQSGLVMLSAPDRAIHQLVAGHAPGGVVSRVGSCRVLGLGPAPSCLPAAYAAIAAGTSANGSNPVMPASAGCDVISAPARGFVASLASGHTRTATEPTTDLDKSTRTAVLAAFPFTRLVAAVLIPVTIGTALLV